MPTNDADVLAEVAALCAAARAKLPASGFHRLHVLLDMLLIDLDRAASPPQTAAAPFVETNAGSAPERAREGDTGPEARPSGADMPDRA